MIENIALLLVCLAAAVLILFLVKMFLLEINYVSNKKMALNEFIDKSGIVCNLVDCADLIDYCKQKKSYFEWYRIFKKLKLI